MIIKLFKKFAARRAAKKQLAAFVAACAAHEAAEQTIRGVMNAVVADCGAAHNAGQTWWNCDRCQKATIRLLQKEAAAR